MDLVFRAVLIGLPLGLALTAIQLGLARRRIVRGFKLHPPPEGVPGRQRYLDKPLVSTLGLTVPLTMALAMTLGAACVAYVALLVGLPDR